VYSDIFDRKGPGRRRRLLPYQQRRRAHRLRRRAAPVVTSVAALLVLIFGVVGFQQAPGASFDDSLYRAVQLFGFGGNPPDDPNVWLQIARFLGPVIVGYAAIRGVLALYREQFDLLRVRSLRNHVVIAGLGDTGYRIATALDQEDRRTVAIVSDPSSPVIEGCRERGILVVKGDATDPAVIEKAGVLHAALLVVTCGDDATNVDVAAAARRVTRGRHGEVLTALVQVDDSELWHILKAQALVDRDESRLRLELFNLSALGAEMLLEEYPAFDPRAHGAAHVLVVGVEGVAPSLILNIVRQWRDTDRSEGDHLCITVASPVAELDLKRIVGRHPGVDAVPACTLGTWNVDLSSAGELQNVPDDVTVVYVCLRSETESLARTLALREQPALQGVEIVIPVADDEAGVGATVRRSLPAFKHVHAFGLLSSNLARLALEHTTTEKIARLTHALHVEHERAAGSADPADPSLLPWDDPGFPHRESNRMYADGIAKKLADLDCMVVPAPLVDVQHPGFALSDEEVERLAPDEHARWESDMKQLGYRRGPVKDHSRKVHPMIDVPYEQLPEENKEKDRQHVRTMVVVLARVGFRIQRADGTGAPGEVTPGARVAR
jgi:TrkA family protein/RyR domain-containing protein